MYADAEDVGRMIAHMMENPSKFLPQKEKNILP
jgi:hypothetical protein